MLDNSEKGGISEIIRQISGRFGSTIFLPVPSWVPAPNGSEHKQPSPGTEGSAGANSFLRIPLRIGWSLWDGHPSENSDENRWMVSVSEWHYPPSNTPLNQLHPRKHTSRRSVAPKLSSAWLPDRRLDSQRCLVHWDAPLTSKKCGAR